MRRADANWLVAQRAKGVAQRVDGLDRFELGVGVGRIAALPLVGVERVVYEGDAKRHRTSVSRASKRLF